MGATLSAMAAVLDGFVPVLLGPQIGHVEASRDQVFAVAQSASNGPELAVAVVRTGNSFTVHELLAPTPDGTGVARIGFESDNASRMPVIEQPMAGLIAIVDGAVLIANTAP